MDKRSKFWLSFAVGAALSFTNLLAPVHEVGHWAVANKYNDEAQITSWSSTRVEPRISQAYAGWWFEIWMFCLLGIFVPLPSMGWAIGYAQISWFRAFASTDFNSFVEKMIKLYNLNGVNAQHIRSMVVQGWIIRGVILFGIVWTIKYFMLRDKAQS